MLRLVALGQLVLGLELLPRPRPAAAERIEETKKAWSPDSADEAVRERAKAMDAKIVGQPQTPRRDTALRIRAAHRPPPTRRRSHAGSLTEHGPHRRFRDRAECDADLHGGDGDIRDRVRR